MLQNKVKTTIRLGIIFLIVVSLNSCEKCMRCYYYYNDGISLGYKQYEHEECGNKKDIQLFKESMEYAAEQFDTTATCTVPW